MILLLANAKGGVCKTTIATNLAVWLIHNRHTKVALVDLDTNKNTKNWGTYRANNVQISAADLPPIDVFYFATDVDAYDKIVELNSKYEYVILDMGGHDSDIFRRCLIIADEIIVPLKPNQGDIDTTSDVLEVIEEANTIREQYEIDQILPYAYFTQVNSNPRVPALREAIEAFQQVKGLCRTIDSTACYFRQAYPSAYQHGLGVMEVRVGATKAANDMKELAEIIFEGK